MHHKDEHRIVVQPWCVGFSETQNKNKRSVFTSKTKQAETLMAPRSHTFYSNQNPLRTQKEGKDILRETAKGTYHIFSHLCFFPVLAK